MIANHEEAVICDLAEYYHIYDYTEKPPLFIATLICGLRDGSRVVSELTDNKLPTNTFLLAGILDSMRNLVWMNSEDGRKNVNRPQLILPILLGQTKSEKEDVTGYSSGAEFEAARKKIINGE